MPTPLEEQLIKQRLAVNNAMSGGALNQQASQGQLPPKPAPPAMFQLNPQVPDPSGLMAAMQQAGLRGQRMTDIELPVPIDELLARAKALEGN